ncbi:hypothetical protein [uncultured Serinicoccus sp.]|nr:hypothetical protein [uncultured Serinicoccus sp.]
MTRPARPAPKEMLRADVRSERGVLWKGLLALVLVLLLAYLRQRWWV